MTIHLSQQEKAKRFYDLHHSGELLILPNIWDCLGALLLEDLRYPAVATASASIAYSNGYNDGENIPFEVVLTILRKITGCVNIPVTADIETGYAENEIEFGKNIRQLIETGITGINIEDSSKKTNTLIASEMQCKRIEIIREISSEMNIPLFINARTDVYVRGNGFETQESKLRETLRRGSAYKASGADGFYPIGMRDKDEIKRIVEEVQLPVNVITFPGIPDLDVLQKIGVARVSLGPSFLKTSIQSMKGLAKKLQNHEGLSEILGNEITSDYLKKLVS